MSALGLFPSRIAGWRSLLRAPHHAFDQVTRLTVDALAGNVVIACVADMEPGKAVVAHVGEDRFAPDVEVTPTGELSIRSAPSLASFATQGQRINTLVLAPPDLPRLDLRLAVGNLFVFGTVGVGSSSSGNMGHVSAAMTAGNVVFADVYADRIDAYNRAGDVVLRWDEERDERDVEMWDSFSDPGMASLSGLGPGGGGGHAGVPPVRVKAGTWLGDTSITCFGPLDPPPWLLAGTNPCRGTKLKVRCLTGERTHKNSAQGVRSRWLKGDGRDFFGEAGEGGGGG